MTIFLSKADKCPKCGDTKLVMASDHPYSSFIGGVRIERDNGTLGEWWVYINPSCKDGEENIHSIETSFVGQEE